MRLHQTKKLLDREGNNQQNEKVNSENGWKYLKTIIIIMSRYLKKVRVLQLYRIKANNQVKNGKWTWVDFSQKEAIQCPTGIWKCAQHHQSSGKCKSKPQWDITSHLLENGDYQKDKR